MKESLVPIPFGGRIIVEKSKQSSHDTERRVEQEESKVPEYKQDYGFKYVGVVCGSSQTLAIIDKSPYLLCWGNGD